MYVFNMYKLIIYIYIYCICSIQKTNIAPPKVKNSFHEEGHSKFQTSHIIENIYQVFLCWGRKPKEEPERPETEASATEDSEARGKDRAEKANKAVSVAVAPVGEKVEKAVKEPKAKPKAVTGTADEFPRSRISMHFQNASSSNQGSAGNPPKSGGGAGKSSNKETNKTDAINTEAAQLIQLFDDVGSVFDINENKVNTILTKITNRLSPELISTCVGDSDERGIRVVALARELKNKVSACLPLVTSLVATSGDNFRPEFLRSALQQCRQQGVAVTSAVDELLAVREVMVLAECGDVNLLVRKLENDLSKLQEDSRHQICIQGSIHAIECIMRPPLPSDEQPSSKENKTNAGIERVRKIFTFVKEIQGSKVLVAHETMKPLSEGLSHLATLGAFLEKTVDKLTKEEVTNVEKARTLISLKTSPFIKCITAFPLGIWMMESTQEALALFHASAALTIGLDSATLRL